MANNKLNIDGIMLFEQPFIRVRMSTCFVVRVGIDSATGTVRELPQGVQDIAKVHREGAGSCTDICKRSLQTRPGDGQ